MQFGHHFFKEVLGREGLYDEPVEIEDVKVELYGEFVRGEDKYIKLVRRTEELFLE